MKNTITIFLKGVEKPIIATNAFVDGEMRLIEFKLESGIKRKIPFESVLYFDLKSN